MRLSVNEELVVLVGVVLESGLLLVALAAAGSAVFTAWNLVELAGCRAGSGPAPAQNRSGVDCAIHIEPAALPFPQTSPHRINTN
jgi:hypothetical protein